MECFCFIKNLLKISLISSLLLSCSTPSLTDRTSLIPAAPSKSRRNIDERALPYVIKFEQYLGRKIPNNVKIRFAIIKDSTTKSGGYCSIDSKVITLNISLWNKRENDWKEMVVFHELGHCVLGRGHLYYGKEWKCMPSIMGWQGTPLKCYRKYYQYYINELFKGCRTFNHKELE